jgi:NAD-specific glutamate dehydrogenase
VHGRLIRHLEARGALHRGIEFLPDDKGLAERAQQKRGLTAPEIAVLLAYAKIALKETLLASSLPDSEDMFINCWWPTSRHPCSRIAANCCRRIL